MIDWQGAAGSAAPVLTGSLSEAETSKGWPSHHDHRYRRTYRPTAPPINGTESGILVGTIGLSEGHDSTL